MKSQASIVRECYIENEKIICQYQKRVNMRSIIEEAPCVCPKRPYCVEMEIDSET